MTMIKASPDVLKQIHLEMNMTESQEKEDVAKLKAWMEMQPHLPEIDDERMLYGFLYGCKNSMERCKKVIDMYYTIRDAAPEFFANRDPKSPEISTCLDTVYVVPMPTLTKNGYRVTVQGFHDPATVNFNAVETMKLTFLVGDIRIREDLCGGDVMVYDMNGSSVSHMGQFTISLVRKFMICAQNAYPSRLRGVHLVNCPNYLDNFLALFKPLMKDKLAERIHVHPDMASLHKHVEKEILPAEFGGDAGPIKDFSGPWRAKLDSYRDWFIASQNIKSDESKRPGGNPITHDELFGPDGSFRQLNVD